MASQTPDLQAVAERLGKVEKQNRRLKSVGIAVLVLVSAVLVIGQTVPKERILLEAEAFILRDKNGNIRAGLMVNEDGEATLFFGDKNGTTRAQLMVHEDGGPILTFRDKNGTARAGLMLDEDGWPILSFYDKNGTVRAGLMLDEDGSPSLSFHDKNGTFRAWLVLEEDGMPSFMLYDENDNKRAVLGFTSLEVTKTGEVRNLPPSSLVLFNKEGKVLFEAP